MASHRGMDDDGVSSVVLLDPILHHVGDRDEVVHPGGCGEVPESHVVEKESHHGTLEETRAADVLAPVFPNIPYGGVAVADVDGSGLRHDAFGARGRAGQDDIVLAQVEPFEGQGHEREEMLVHALATREPLQETGANVHGVEPRIHAVGRVDRGEDRSLGVHGGEIEDALFCTSHVRQPVMDHSKFHSLTFLDALLPNGNWARRSLQAEME